MDRCFGCGEHKVLNVLGVCSTECADKVDALNSICPIHKIEMVEKYKEDNSYMECSKCVKTRHTFYKCDGKHEAYNCQFCDGGLTYCTVCGGAEASLTSDCPGYKLLDIIQDAIGYLGWDYKDGQFVAPIMCRRCGKRRRRVDDSGFCRYCLDAQGG